MKRFHISISTENFSASIQDYTRRLGAEPSVVEEGRYALWRTELLNFTISCKPGQKGGQVRHLGFEDDAAKGFSEEKDTNGITWESFSSKTQEKEIDEKFPGAVKNY
jgi:catechol 2,3-dioxygenase-like lactoylglutathione lyase family enzyme